MKHYRIHMGTAFGPLTFDMTALQLEFCLRAYALPCNHEELAETLEREEFTVDNMGVDLTYAPFIFNPDSMNNLQEITAEQVDSQNKKNTEALFQAVVNACESNGDELDDLSEDCQMLILHLCPSLLLLCDQKSLNELVSKNTDNMETIFKGFVSVEKLIADQVLRQQFKPLNA